jgi:probable rRNA maturation factor
MSRDIWLKNRCRRWAVDLKLLRKITRHVLEIELNVSHYDLGLFLVGESEMTKLNEGILKHAGSTDVITFDYGGVEFSTGMMGSFSPCEGEKGGMRGASKSHAKVLEVANRKKILQGELFICLDEAQFQARRYHTIWQSEIVRYIIHGLLHLLGYDDLKPVARRKMKRQENLVLRKVSAQFSLDELSRKKQ